MEVRAKKSLGQHFLTDLSIARRIVDALEPTLCDGLDSKAIASKQPDCSRNRPLPSKLGPLPLHQAGGGQSCLDAMASSYRPGTLQQPFPTLEIGPGMGVISQYLLEREDLDFRMIEIDHESVEYLLGHFPKAYGRVLEGDFLRINLKALYGDNPFLVIGNFPYNISSQIFFKILEHKDQIPQVVCMIQKEVAERIAEKPGSKTYGILSVLLQAWYDIEYLFTVGSGAFAPPPKVQSAVIRLRRNSRTDLGCDEALFKTVVKTAFGQRRKTLRNSLKPIIQSRGVSTADSVFDLRPEALSVEDFIELTGKFE